MPKSVTGFSKLSKSKKIDWIVDTYFNSNPSIAKQTLEQYWSSNIKLQQLHDEFIENTISNFYLPFGVAPNFLINGNLYTIPMTIEESSVVAAASNAAKFWLDKGGFKAQVLSTTKIGQVHFNYNGDFNTLEHFFNLIKPKLIASAKPITKNMEKRGGGILDIELRDKTKDLKNYYQLHASFETLNAMGANFINSCLELFAETFKTEALNYSGFKKNNSEIDIVMSILSNYVPECLVKASVSCSVDEIEHQEGVSGKKFAEKIVQAVAIASCETFRAVTHNKGIMNGVDALIIATGNDFRAIEAGVHAYAARNGQYTSLSKASIIDDQFTMELILPLALGTVGGLTKLHPMVGWSMELLGNPDAKKLMQIVAVAGLAQNFAALRSLVTSGIQKGHMKMHLFNILNQLGAKPVQKEAALNYFKKNMVSVKAVSDFLHSNET